MARLSHLVHGSAPLFLALSTLLAACSNDDDSSPTPEDTGSADEAALDEAGIADLESLADRAVGAGIPGVSIAIRRGEQRLTIVRGVADRESGAPLTPDHRFRVASVSKSFVASVLLQLVDEGRIALSDTLEQWLPGMVKANGHATIEQLVRQQTGYFDFGTDPRLMQPYMEGDFEHYWSPEALVGLSNDHPPNFAPGERYEYSNTNFTLLGLVIEKIEGKPLAEVVKVRITEPLGLTSTKQEISSHLDSPYARGYIVGLGDGLTDVTDMSGSAVYGSGNLISTPSEMIRFYDALVAGKVVTPARLPAMFAIADNVPGTHYAMGVFRDERTELYPCATFIGHDGGIPGYDVTAYSSLDGKRAFSVVVNSFSPLDEHAGGPEAHAAWSELNKALACR